MPKVSRRSFIATTATSLLAGQASSLASRVGRRPNVILFLTDDQAYGDLSHTGNKYLKTPNLDSVAKDGTELTRFYVSPVCSPTRASLMTGRYNYRTGIVDTYMGRSMMYPDEITIAEILKKAGYRTGIFGKWHLGDDYPLRTIDHGFEESLVLRGGGLEQPANVPHDGYFDPLLQHNGNPEKYHGYCTDIFVNAAMEFIEDSRNRPFFAYIPTNAPHAPLVVDPSYVAPFQTAGLNDQTAKLYGMLTNVDENMGRLLAKLQALGLEQDTVLVFLSDNGPEQERYNAGLRGLKGSVYEGGMRVPCFIRWPHVIPSGQRIDRIAAHIDILPTVLEACGVEAPAGLNLDGRSVFPLLREAKEEWPDRTLYFQWHRGDEPEILRNCCAVAQRYKWLSGPAAYNSPDPQGYKQELYDLREDPGEKADLSPGHEELVTTMRNEYEDWFYEVSSTRGYAPPRIQLGTRHENPVMLTTEDWRGPRAGWGNPDSQGYWEVEVPESARCEVTLLFKATGDSGTACFMLNGASFKQPVQKGATECKFAVAPLRIGKGRLEAFVRVGTKTVGAQYVYVKRL
jgi:arylsulfatase A-like enzyme